MGAKGTEQGGTTLDRVAQGIAAVPILLLVAVLAVPSLRLRLFGPPLPSPVEASKPAPATPTARPPAREAAGGKRRADPAVRPASPEASPTPRTSATPSPSATPLTSTGRTTVLTGPAVDQLVERTYRPYLPAAVGPLKTLVSGDRIKAEAEVDVALLRRELSAPVPTALQPFFQGKPTLRVEGRIVGSRDGIADLRLDHVTVAGIPVPDRLVSHFLQGELESRGFAPEDPLVRPLVLPAGIDRASVEGDSLLLTARNAR